MEKIEFKNLQENIQISKEKFNLFKKFEEQKSVELNLKVGKIVEIKKHPNAEKLFIEKIDLGEQNKRQIISGLVDFYTENELLNKKVVVVANLETAKIRGEISEGMVLASENTKGEVGVLLAENLEIGENLKTENQVFKSLEKINIKKFFKICKMKSKNSKVFFENSEVKNISVDKNIEGEIR